MAYSQSWLENPASNRDLFIEVVVYDVLAVADTTFYLSTTGYLTSDASTMYQPIITNGSQITETLSLDNSAGLSFGDIEINNPEGLYDLWLDPTKYVWVNRSIKIYLGDPLWVATNLAQIHTDFQLIFDGIVADIDSKSRNFLNIKIRDKLERLNTPLNEVKMGNTYFTNTGLTQTDQDNLRPIVFGEVFNISPVLYDPVGGGSGLREYMYCKDASEQVIEVRDNGIPVYTYPTMTYGATIDLTTGKFRLTNGLYGACTCSVQGVKQSVVYSSTATATPTLSATYSNNIASLIGVITTQYGRSFYKLALSELDNANLYAFSIANTQSVGIFVTGSDTVIGVCQQLASSIGAQLFMSRLGKLQLLQIGVPTADASVTIIDTDILFSSLNISSKVDVIATNKLGYCFNYTTQPGLVTDLPDSAKEDLKLDWLTYTYPVDTTTKNLYKLSDDDPIQKDTQLLVTSEVQTEATRLVNYYKVPKTIYKFTGTAKLLSLKLGQGVTLIHNRFNLWNSGSGRTGQVVSLSPNWMAGTVDVEVIV